MIALTDVRAEELKEGAFESPPGLGGTEIEDRPALDLLSECCGDSVAIGVSLPDSLIPLALCTACNL